MTMLINPGSRIASPEYDGEWQNTETKARERALVWLGKMHAEGMTDVELLDDTTERGGRWLFTFRHKVTGATATLEMHGIDPVAAYEREHVFAPRVYWNGSSCADPALEDFAAPGFVPVRTFALAAKEGDWPMTNEAMFWCMEAERHADPFACIPNSSDDEYAGTILETPQQRERRERQHTINGASQDAAPAAAGEKE